MKLLTKCYLVPFHFEKIMDFFRCDRCNKIYEVTESGHQVEEEECVYHWGRNYSTRGNRGRKDSIAAVSQCFVLSGSF